MASFDTKRLLSIQSHVVHGYVGNRAATFPLQLRGWDVDALNSVHLSNHTGYGSFRGTKASAAEIKDVYEGLKEIGFEYDAILTGYVPTAEALATVGEICQDISERFPHSIWVLDPVMGDEGKLYVSEAVIPIYKRIIKEGNVTIVTPNAFEAEILTGIKITSVETAKQAMQVLHTEYNVPNVVLSSVTLPDSDSTLYAFGSTKKSDGTARAFYFGFPVLKGYFTGTGDLFAALTLDRFHKYAGHGDDGKQRRPAPDSVPADQLPLFLAVKDVLGMMHSVLERTLHFSKSLGGTLVGVIGDAESMKSLELQVVQCKDIILPETAPLYKGLQINLIP
ncbi:putative pyridoxal kinase BUD17 [Sugiyamaella lignohabitans]|uniref:pyridoxal kinase n=1 Tax=Sugiyamaella lignohabitans TaxID=796027 RepID=A0A167F7J8_9ASCO|nr:putative pyridoxal kinase BUD17 [Sugiyamaella lignohabitans]ANB14913.1 putative pyridoxal kinase BUD17 [Sugiyamaella lignohabitans]